MVLASSNQVLRLSDEYGAHRRTFRTSTIGTPLQNSFGTLLSQLPFVTSVPLNSIPRSLSYARLLVRTSEYAPTPGSGQEKKPKSEWSVPSYFVGRKLTRHQPQMGLIVPSVESEQRIVASSSIRCLYHKSVISLRYLRGLYSLDICHWLRASDEDGVHRRDSRLCACIDAAAEALHI